MTNLDDVAHGSGPGFWQHRYPRPSRCGFR
jgi:hypothetical protein